MTDPVLFPLDPELSSVAIRGGLVSVLSAGSGPPALFLHSAGGAQTWSPLHQAIAGQRTLYAPDHPGFGRSDVFPELRSAADIAEHYLRLIDKLELSSIDLIGSSFGGWVAVELAAQVPERIRSLTLLCPAGLDVPEAPVTNLFALEPIELVRHLFHSSDIIDKILSTPPSAEAAAATERDMHSLARFASDPVLCDPTLRSRLPSVAASTLVVAAGEDRIVPRRHGEIYAAEIPLGRLVVVADVGHVLEAENAAPVIDALMPFLNETLQDKVHPD